MAKTPKGKPTKEQIAAVIWGLRDEHGDIQPSVVVEEARDPDSLLHDQFEWRSEILIQQQLEARALELIKQCRSIVQMGEFQLIIPTYVVAPRKKKKTYSPTLVIARDNVLKTLTLERELTGIKNAIHRAMSLAIVFDLGARFDTLLREIVEIEADLANRSGSGAGAGSGKGKGKGKGGKGRKRRDDNDDNDDNRPSA
jgi:hypothetical protein